jgi:hypothetical protein
MKWYRDAEKVRQHTERAYQRMSDLRAVREDHLQYVLGPWYDKKPMGRRVGDRPLGLLGQAIFAQLSVLVPQDPVIEPQPKRLGLDFESMVLKIKLDAQFQDMNAARDVYRPVVGDAMVSPLGITYTGRQPSGVTVDIEGVDVDAGDSYMEHIPFPEWFCDQACNVFRNRAWEGHYFEANREILLSLDAYRQFWDTIRDLPTASATRGQRGMSDRSDVAVDADGNIQLLNFVTYEGGKVYERVFTASGRAVMLREVDYCLAGPDNGPYDHLWFYQAPGKLMPVAPASLWRDCSEATDRAYAKMVKQWMASKSVLTGPKSAKKDLENVANASNLGVVATDNPESVKVQQLEFVLGSTAPILTMMMQSWNTSTNNPQLLRGNSGGEGSDTARGMSILQSKNVQQSGDLFSNVADLMDSHGAKLSHWLLTDPTADYQVAHNVGETNMRLYLTAGTITAKPKDFRYKVMVRAMDGVDPNVRIARIR